jgi:hypothetical protein
MNYEYKDCWKDTNRVDLKYSEKDLRYKSHVDWSGIECRPLWLRDQRLTTWAMTGWECESSTSRMRWTENMGNLDWVWSSYLQLFSLCSLCVLSRITDNIHLCLRVGVSTAFAPLWLVTVCSPAATLLAWLSLLTQLTSPFPPIPLEIASTVVKDETATEKPLELYCSIQRDHNQSSHLQCY